MSAYTKHIIRFGLVTPVAFNFLLLGGVLFGVSKLGKIRTLKEERYNEQTQRVAAMQKLEKDLAPKRGNFQDQKKLLEADAGQLFTRILDAILPKYKEIELERTGLIFPLDRGSVARPIAAEVARVKSSFQGGFGPMQETLLQVESLMPQAVLEDLKISRKTDTLLGKQDSLTLEMTHTCWKTGEAKP